MAGNRPTRRSTPGRRRDSFCGYSFKDISLLNQALTHGSIARHHSEANHRLAVVGRAVLDFVISEQLFQKYPDAPAGWLTVERNRVRDPKNLHQAAIRAGVRERLLAGESVRIDAQQGVSKIVIAAYRAVFGAAFLDGGLEACVKIARPTLLGFIGRPVLADEDIWLGSHRVLTDWAKATRAATPQSFRLKPSPARSASKAMAVVMYCGGFTATGCGTSRVGADDVAAGLLLQQVVQAERRGPEEGSWTRALRRLLKGPWIGRTKCLGHRFRDPALLRRALTHRTYDPRPADCNESLEFLGDAVLDVVVAAALFRELPNVAATDLPRVASEVVKNDNLASKSAETDLSARLRVGRWHERRGVRKGEKHIADAFEAVLGAAYLDAGITASTGIARRFLLDGLLRDLATEPHPATQDGPDRPETERISNREMLHRWALSHKVLPPQYETQMVSVDKKVVRVKCGDFTAKAEAIGLHSARDLAAKRLLHKIAIAEGKGAVSHA